MNKFMKSLSVAALVLLLGVTVLVKNPSSVSAEGEFMFGVETLISEKKSLLEGKRVGLVTNPTGVDKNLNSIVDLLFEDPDINLTALYGPEHGVRGNAQAGAYVESYTDPVTQLPVYSLYGKTRKPSPEMLENVDVMLFDIQDAGVTYYTYVWSMLYVMEAAAENGKEVIILDRPNPLGGNYVGGPVVVEPGNSSFVGLKDIAVVHGMTFGELAKYFNTEFGINAKLEVVEMQNYNRNNRYDDLGVPFVMPSPNMPTTDTIDVYPITGFFESFKNVSEGRGTTKPFELVGAEFVNSTDYARELNALNLPGVRFRAAAFTPAPGQKLAGKLVQGVEVYVTNVNTYDPIHTGLSMMQVLNNMYPNDVEWRTDGWLAKLTGKSYIEQDIKNNVPVDQIIAKWDQELEDFKVKRENYLIYNRTAPQPSEYVVTANDFTVKVSEVKDLTDEQIIAKSNAKAVDQYDAVGTLLLDRTVLKEEAGEYVLKVSVKEQSDKEASFTVKVVKDDDGGVAPVDPTKPITPPGEGGSGSAGTGALDNLLPNTGQAMTISLVGVALIGIGTMIYRREMKLKSEEK